LKKQIEIEVKRLGGNPIIEKMVAKLSSNLNLEKLEAVDKMVEGDD